MTSSISKWLAALALLASCFAIQGCSEDDAPEPEPSTPAPTGSPFSATLEGPDVASPGDRVTATLTNTGRLPDGYRLVSEPEGGASFTPLELRLGPQESAEVTIEVITSPVIVKVESIGGGGPGTAVAQLSIGAQGGG